MLISPILFCIAVETARGVAGTSNNPLAIFSNIPSFTKYDKDKRGQATFTHLLLLF